MSRERNRPAAYLGCDCLCADARSRLAGWRFVSDSWQRTACRAEHRGWGKLGTFGSSCRLLPSYSVCVSFATVNQHDLASRVQVVELDRTGLTLLLCTASAAAVYCASDDRLYRPLYWACAATQCVHYSRRDDNMVALPSSAGVLPNASVARNIWRFERRHLKNNAL